MEHFENSAAWEAAVLPLNYARKPAVFAFRRLDYLQYIYTVLVVASWCAQS